MPRKKPVTRQAKVKLALNEKQKLVAHFYLADPERNRINAYLKVYPPENGSEPSTKGRNGVSRLFTNPDFIEYLAALIDNLHKKVHLDEELVLREWIGIATLDIGDAFDSNGKLLPVKKMPVHIRKAISSIEVDEDSGSTKIKFNSKNDALKSLGSHMGMFKKIKELRLTWMDSASPLEMLERRKYLEDEMIKRGLLPAPIEEKDITPEEAKVIPNNEVIN